MPIAKILIITDKDNRTSKFSSPPYNLPIDSFLATGLDSLEYIGLHGYSVILIDFDISNIIRKIALGISDDKFSESMWSLLAPSNNSNVYLLTEKIIPPTRDMVALGIEYILPSGVLALNNASAISSPQGKLTSTKMPSGMLTADDIRTMHKSGNTIISAGARMTPWAKEIADSLEMTEEVYETTLILPVLAQTKAELISHRERFFSLITAHANLLFAMPSAIIPIFTDLFPSISSRVISIGVCWAEKGAFTGENSIAMLKSVGCCGSIMLDEKPYTDVENISKLLKLASKSGFKIFSFFPLAQDAECGIIERKERALLIPLLDVRSSSEQPSSHSGALIVNDKYLKELKKGI